MTQQVVHGFILKRKQSILMLILRILILLSAAAANGSLKNSVTLKYLNNFWKSLECHLATAVMKMILISIILFLLLSKILYYMSLLSLYKQKTTKNYEIFLAKDLKDPCIGMNIK